MAFTSKDIIGYFNKMKPPYNVSLPNQQAVMEKIADLSSYKKEVTSILKERERISLELNQLSIVKRVYPSDANFLLTETVDATLIYNYLVDRKVIVRNRHSVINNGLRITIGTPEENNVLLAALSGLDDEMTGKKNKHMKKTLFIDRDGTILKEPEDEQIDSLDKLSFVPGAITTLAKIATETDFELVMVTNQDGLGTASFPEDTFWPSP